MTELSSHTLSAVDGGPRHDADVARHLRAGGVSVIITADSGAMPSIVYWGADLGELDDDALHEVLAATEPRLDNSVDSPRRVGIVPEASTGWLGAPGLQGHRVDGSAWSPKFVDVRHEVHEKTLTSRGSDATAGLELTVIVELTESGLLRARAEVSNTADSGYTVDRLAVTLPVPPVAHEILDQTGRWAKERVPQRRDIVAGTHLRESRRGRTGADAATVLVAGERSFGFQSGEVWGLHVGWSGNHLSYVERHNNGHTLLGGGELLLPGEVALSAAESYSTPWVYGSYGVGLDEQAARFHAYLRSRPQHPTADRPVTLNVWEAVYFNHRLDTLLELADRAAEVGVERYVLDDGWFRHRRSDDAGLGDWYVDEGVWPDGLSPLVERVRERGMEFGLWFEPEMVNPDSDLARQHPEWIMQTGGRMPLEARSQQVLNVAIPEAYEYLLARISSLVSEYKIDYIKWDHNRDLIEPGSTARAGAAGTHEQTAAVYRLLEELKRRHPGLEIESCSSGGARVDLGVLEFTDRVWASDCIDPLERQQILRWTAQLLPPELVGNHIAGPRSHTTSRTHDLSFRATTALIGHLGVEWNIAQATDAERAELREWIALHKRFRSLIHTGTVVRPDAPDDAVVVSGIRAEDASEALIEIAMCARPAAWPPSVIRIPGLDPERRYRVAAVGPDAPRTITASTPAWQRDGGLELTGRALGLVGIQVPPLHVEHAALAHITGL
ncbi:alpha-galactosidase [Microbacterium sp. MPKO10]|uniref:alpha-galactosidase n=1 Tax=Microbacterium sp. MPKO10 TaxID=2989818 RepID=UPI0022363D46|nr:alpha-galactosidase [Microbacterium sp. MPKO10]MCW4457001.1 alpha-galactosidase [Microbacterium sp. MPKO10]